ncbi:toxin-antitoxin system YwqK family antitoxin [Stenoxybacter acetivorans]|uniref:toxin-antitoxin system YwqK family antitoxin n=1 Tax=Stenoxybacter acetivorans TaxID=422441 RepID=UPI00068E865A|nr:hypothetical protein [Stenoxybacter acetivorans]
MKWRLLIGLIIAACSLTACQTTQLSAGAIPQPQSIASLIAEKVNQPDLYFDKTGQYRSTPVKDGFYRKVLGKTKDGGWVIQNFYQDSQTKQTDPIVVFHAEGLRDFSNDVIDGLVIWYRPDGSRNSSAYFMRGKPTGSAMTYDEQGRVRIVDDLNADGETQILRHYNEADKLIKQVAEVNGAKEARYWYSNGKPAAVYTSDKLEAWDTDGTVLSDIQSGYLIFYLDSSLYEEKGGSFGNLPTECE